MKKSRFRDAQSLAMLKQGENGVPVADLCRERGMVIVPKNHRVENWASPAFDRCGESDEEIKI